MRRIFLWLCALACIAGSAICVVSPAYGAQATIAGFVLPSRRADRAATIERTEKITAAVRERLSALAVADPKRSGRLVYLAHLLEHAQALAIAAKLDEAAGAFDSALADGVRGIDRLANPQAFVTAHFQRVSIAFARNEGARADDLLARVIRYDPTVALVGEENRPRMQAALETAKKRLGERPELRAEDLGDACRAADTVLIARVLDEPGAALEIVRYDRCVRAASVTSTSMESDAAIAAELAPGAPPVAIAKPAAQPRKKIYVAPLVLAVSSVALIGAGAGLVGWANSDYDRLLGQCGNAGACAPSAYSSAHAGETAGYALLGIGGAAAATSLIVWLVERRPRPASR
jgi:hypothetical protein